MKGHKENKIDPIFLYDEEIRRNYPLIAGIDEAGRGPLAGPVVTSAVILPEGLIIQGLKDSKQLSHNERKRVFWEVVSKSIDIGIGIIESQIIDRTNILKSTRLAMEAALRDLREPPDILLIDALSLPGIKIPQRSIIKGESQSASIAAASIVAKVIRDDIMLRYHEEYPIYNFKEHKGYCTKEHIKLLQIHGPCPIHRKSFRKVMDMELPL